MVAKNLLATRQALAGPTFTERRVASGIEPVPHSEPADVQRYVDDETRRLVLLIKSVGFELD